MKNTVTKCTQGNNNKIRRGTNTRTIIEEIKEDYAQIAQRKYAVDSAINTWATRESGSQQSQENNDVKKNCTLGKYTKLSN